MRHPRAVARLSRRQFLRGAAGAALAASAAGPLLAACGTAPPVGGTAGPTPTGSSFPLAREDNPVTWPIEDDNRPIGSGRSPERGATLKVYNWADYIYLKWVREFEKEFGCTVEISRFNTTDQALAKLRTGQVDFDVYFPDPSLLGKLVAAKLVQPLNHDYLPNLSNVWPNLQDPFYDGESRYTVPYTIYTTGIGWRADFVQEDPFELDNGYDFLSNPKYAGKVHLLDDYRETISMALLKNGITDINTDDPADLDVAVDELVELDEAVNPKLDVSQYEDLPAGRAWIHQAWSGDLIAAQYNLPRGTDVSVLRYWYPPEGGGVIGSDNMVVLRTARNPVLAHEFLNFMLDNEVAYSNFVDWNGYQAPMNDIDPDRLVSDRAIPETLASAVVKPSDFDTGHTILELSPAVDGLWHDAFQRFLSGG